MTITFKKLDCNYAVFIPNVRIGTIIYNPAFKSWTYTDDHSPNGFTPYTIKRLRKITKFIEKLNKSL